MTKPVKMAELVEYRNILRDNKMKEKRFLTKFKDSILTETTLHFSLIFIGSVILGETISMLIIILLPPLSQFFNILIDSVLLLIISFPIYYFFILSKLKNQIRESKQAELALYESDALYRTLVEKMPDGVYKSTHDGKFVDVNPAMVKILGYETKEELMAIDIKSQLYFEPGDRESLVLEDKLQEMGIYRLKKKDGSEIWVEDHGWYNLGENGEILFHEGILRDITDRRKAEGELRKERLLLRTVIDNIPDSIYCKDTAGRKTLANLCELRLLQINSESEILGKTDFDLYPKEFAEGFFSDDQLVLQTGQPVINREEFVMDNNGLKRWLLTSKISMKDEYGNITGLMGIGRDVTSRRQAEAELRESEVRLNVILQSTADGILAIDGNGKIIKSNKRFARLWNIPQNIIDSGDDNELLNFVLIQLTNPDEFISKVKKLYRSTDKDLDYLHFKDGRIFERYSAPLIISDAEIGRVWSFRDITERKLAEDELLASKQLIEGIINAIPVRIFWKDRNSVYMGCNKIFANDAGFSDPKDLIGKDDFQMGWRDQAEMYRTGDRQVMESGNSILLNEEPQTTPEGNTIILLTNKIPLINSMGKITGILGTSMNVTERIEAVKEIKLKNEQLLLANAEKDKFFSIIAHDLKGPFNGFLGLTQVMAEQLPSLTLAEVQKIAISMSNSANNLYYLLENLLEWSQIQKGAFPFNPEGFQLDTVVRNSIDMILESAKLKNIEISHHVADGLLAFADMNMLQTIIRNLVFNAIKFTPKGGKITLLAKTTSDNNFEISIQDTGIGMNQYMIENLFRIDVQTNRKGTEGELSTGLGLLLCKEFTEKNRGKIWVESAEGEGSTFYFTLPIYKPSESNGNNGIEIFESGE